MKYMKNKYIKYKKAELERFLKDKKSCVKKVNRSEILAVSPHHLATIKNYITCVLNAKIGKHHRDLDGIVLDFRNVKVLNTNTELRFEDPLIRITIITDYYVFRPHRGAVLRGVIKHTNQHSLGVILYRVFTVSIKLDGGKAGKKLAINQEIEFRVTGFNFDNKFATIDGEFIKSYELPSTAKLNGSIKKFDKQEKEAAKKANHKTKVVVKQEPASSQTSSDSSSDEQIPTPSTSTGKVTIKKEVVEKQSDSSDDDTAPAKKSNKNEITSQKSYSNSRKVVEKQSDSSSSDEAQLPDPPKRVVKKEIASPQSSDSSSEENEAPPLKQKTLAKKPIIVKREPVTNGKSTSDSNSSEKKSKKSTKLVKKEPVNGHSDNEISAVLKPHKTVTKTESTKQRKRKREETSIESGDSEREDPPPAKRSNTETLERVVLAPVRRKILQSESDSDNLKTSTSKLKIKPEKEDAPLVSKKVKPVSDDEDDLDGTISALLSQFKAEPSTTLNGKIKKVKGTMKPVESSPSILKASGGGKKKKQTRKSVTFPDFD